MKPSTPATGLLALCLALSACSTLRGPGCAPGQDAAVQDVLYFGAQAPAGAVSPDAWAQFLAVEVTPRFPAGLTTWQAWGQWRGASGVLVRESSYVLNLVHPDDAASEAAVAAIAGAYKQQFAQEAVLRVRSAACMSL